MCLEGKFAATRRYFGEKVLETHHLLEQGVKFLDKLGRALVGSVAIRRSYKGGDMSINPEVYQEFNTGCCSRRKGVLKAPM